MARDIEAWFLPRSVTSRPELLFANGLQTWATSRPVPLTNDNNCSRIEGREIMGLKLLIGPRRGSPRNRCVFAENRANPKPDVGRWLFAPRVGLSWVSVGVARSGRR